MHREEDGKSRRPVEKLFPEERQTRFLSALEGVCYLERVAVSTPKDVIKAKKAVKKAFENQIAGKGFSLVEILSMCPTDWKLSPKQAMDFVNDKMKDIFPLGVYKDR